MKLLFNDCARMSPFEMHKKYCIPFIGYKNVLFRHNAQQIFIQFALLCKK